LSTVVDRSVGLTYGELVGVGKKSGLLNRGSISESLPCDDHLVDNVEGYGTSTSSMNVVTIGYGAINKESDRMEREDVKMYSQSLTAGLSDTHSGLSNGDGKMDNNAPVLGVIGLLNPSNPMIDCRSNDTCPTTESDHNQSWKSKHLTKIRTSNTVVVDDSTENPTIERQVSGSGVDKISHWHGLVGAGIHQLAPYTNSGDSSSLRNDNESHSS